MGSTPRPKHLIINADDFGLTRGVNIGIIEAAEAGVVTSASMIVNLPGFADALDRALTCPALSLGVHLNLTLGRPVTQAASLTRRKTGEFYPLAALITRASLGLLDTADIFRECVAQIDRMIEAGFPPTHLDSHRHVHVHPAIFPTIANAAASRGISRLRVPCEPFGVNARDWRATLKKAGLLFCVALSVRPGVKKSADKFFGISLQGGKSFAARLFALVPQLPAGTTELMVHPGYADAALAEQDSYRLERETELRVLCSREFRELLDRCGVTLTRFGAGGDDDRSSIVPQQRQLAQHH
ncbi:MAG TPA: ChbG/HpnK family deacetylase [Gemmatimonadaceae bacterium]